MARAELIQSIELGLLHGNLTDDCEGASSSQHPAIMLESPAKQILH